MDSYVGTPLIALPTFRKQLERLLRDKSFGGRLKYDGKYRLTFLDEKGGFIGSYTSAMDDPWRPGAGKELPFRVCDYVAWKLESLGAFPHIGLYWPEHVRDDAVAHTQAIMRQYGDRFNLPKTGQTPGAAGNMTFPELRHPATQEDVAKGLAIFALDGERRVVPRPDVGVRWTKLRAISNVFFGSDSADAPAKPEVIWMQDGAVWQAEEVKQGDKWVRWYGFVGPGFIGKVPATEIEAQADSNWTECSHGIQWHCDMPAMETAVDARIPIEVGKPILVRLHIRNALGVPQAVPSEWYRSKENAFRPDVSLRVHRSTRPVPNRTGWGDDGWEQFPVRPARHFTPTGATQTLNIGQQLPTVTFDVRDLCDLGKPGQYLVQLIAWSDSRGDPGETNSMLFTVVAATPAK